MAAGYVIMAIPTGTPVPADMFAIYLAMSCFGLFIIAFGNGLFKGNLQALVGQMYDAPEYGKMRDSGFQWFYMFINVGAIFAPLAAVGVRNWWVSSNGFQYNSDLPSLCHLYLSKGEAMSGIDRFRELALQSGQGALGISDFASEYLEF